MRLEFHSKWSIACLLASFVMLAETYSHAQELSPEEFGKMLDGAVPGLLKKYEEPGLAAALIIDGEMAWIKTYGYADVAKKIPVSKNTFFQMGSISKTLTAWGVMKLANNQLIDLDQPVEKYLKRWQLPESKFNNGVTIRRLLNHTAGFPESSISGVDLGTSVPSLVEELNGASASGRAVRVTNKPGEKYRYSGDGYTILQLLIEDVTGQDFDKYMQQEILKPLNMNHTFFGWNESIAKGVALPYQEGGIAAYPHRLFSSLSAAGMYSTVEDMAKFVAAQSDRNDTLLDNKTLAKMIEVAPSHPRYGLGYEIYPEASGFKIIGHGGSNFGWKANFFVCPSTGDGFVVMTNVDVGKSRTEVAKAYSKFLVKKLQETRR